MKDLIGYDKIIENSMRGVIKNVLQKVEKFGLLGDHYFVISFCTTAKGVKIPKKLKDKFPEEMTVVIQYQFNYIMVKDSHFIISLSFSGQFEELTIPYDTITSFADPSINFGLKFNNYDILDFEDEEGEEEDFEVKTSNSNTKTKTKKKQVDTSAKVVSLDDFRKNNNKK
jgi:uncharacterized protein